MYRKWRAAGPKLFFFFSFIEEAKKDDSVLFFVLLLLGPRSDFSCRWRVLFRINPAWKIEKLKCIAAYMGGKGMEDAFLFLLFLPYSFAAKKADSD